MENEIKYYARPSGGHYHTNLDCSMLIDGQFEKLKYQEIPFVAINGRKLIPCSCVERKRYASNSCEAMFLD